MRGWASSSSRRWEFRLESVRTAVSVAVETRAAVVAAGCIGAPSLPPNPRPSSIRSPDTSRPGWPPAANPPVPPAASSHRLHPLAPSPQRLLRSTPMTWHDTTGRDRTGQDRTGHVFILPDPRRRPTDRPTDLDPAEACKPASPSRVQVPDRAARPSTKQGRAGERPHARQASSHLPQPCLARASTTPARRHSVQRLLFPPSAEISILSRIASPTPLADDARLAADCGM